MMSDWDEEDDFKLQHKKIAHIARLLARHPDCRDPDHPGCECCEAQQDAIE